MKRIFVDDFGDMRIGWVIFLAMFTILGLAALGASFEGRAKAAYYTKITGKPMTAWEAVWVSPDFSVAPVGDITVKLSKEDEK